MRLSKLIASSDGLSLRGNDVEITGITLDSRLVKPGYLFIATPGFRQDGRAFIDEALSRGAVAIVVPQANDNAAASIPGSAAEVLTTDIRHATAILAARFYPRQPETVVAVTGTSGKTSTAQFVRELWHNLGRASASIGTLGLVTAKETHYGALTTPDSVTLHHMLDTCTGEGITHLVFEASSHGLDLRRLDQVKLKAGGFTNLSQDHLDYHETRENYFAAKLRLFSELLPPGSAAVLNADVPEYAALVKHATARGLKIISYGKDGKDIRLIETIPNAHGQILQLAVLGKTYKDILLPEIGAFQAWNAMCALGLAIGCGEDAEKTVAGLPKFSGVPGRLQWIGTSKKGGAVFVDYAHKPDGLEKVLQTMRAHVAPKHGAKLGVAFGAGGDRDRIKRPQMGEIATRLADWVIITDDNPRTEDAASIRQQILTGCTGAATVKEIPDRADAIKAGIAMLNKDDVFIIAGKGHEPGQIVGDKILPFDDAEVARKELGL